MEAVSELSELISQLQMPRGEWTLQWFAAAGMTLSL